MTVEMFIQLIRILSMWPGKFVRLFTKICRSGGVFQNYVRWRSLQMKKNGIFPFGLVLRFWILELDSGWNPIRLMPVLGAVSASRLARIYLRVHRNTVRYYKSTDAGKRLGRQLNQGYRPKLIGQIDFNGFSARSKRWFHANMKLR